jgi:ankyrin repeat protein
MIELLLGSLRKKDCIGRTQLHVAAGSGASSLVIRILYLKYPHACNIQDEDGMTSLHLACNTNCVLFEEDKESSPRGPPNLDTMYALLASSLDVVTLEDINGMNAVEHALFSDTLIEVITLLQKATSQGICKQSTQSSM